MRRSRLRCIANALMQAIWCLPQNLLGAAVYLFYKGKRRQRYGFSRVTRLARPGNSMSLGAFVFVAQNGGEAVFWRTCAHEYGHTLQSMLLGPLYLPVVALPSLVWCYAFAKWRKQHGVPYGRFYTERWADRLGERFCPEQRAGEAPAEPATPLEKANGRKTADA